jgi:molecular chaperone DnaJ
MANDFQKMAKRDYYEVLGVPKNADEASMKSAYRKLAMQHHPDRNPGDKAAEDKFKEAAEAYDVLSNPDKKARYDRMGHAGVDGSMGGGGRGGGGGHFTSMEDIFAHFGDIFGDGGQSQSGNPFESFFGNQGGGGQRRSQGTRGTNLRIKVRLTLEEVATGVQKKIKVRKQMSCETCHGSGAKDANAVSTCQTCRGSGYVRQVRTTFLGQMATTTGCPTCKGSGRVVTANCNSCRGEGTIFGEETLDLQIPAGVADGMELQVGGKGNAGTKGGGNGDLYISIEEVPHETLHREGINVHHEVFISFADASLGTTVEVPTLDGRVKMRINPGTQSGKVLRLADKGLPSIQQYNKRGDQLVHVNIWTPKRLTDEERNLLEKMQNMSNFQPKPEKEDRGFFEKLRDIFR